MRRASQPANETATNKTNHFKGPTNVNLLDEVRNVTAVTINTEPLTNGTVNGTATTGNATTPAASPALVNATIAPGACNCGTKSTPQADGTSTKHPVTATATVPHLEVKQKPSPSTQCYAFQQLFSFSTCDFGFCRAYCAPKQVKDPRGWSNGCQWWMGLNYEDRCSGCACAEKTW